MTTVFLEVPRQIASSQAQNNEFILDKAIKACTTHLTVYLFGELVERLMALVLKTSISSRVSRVQIPNSPPLGNVKTRKLMRVFSFISTIDSSKQAISGGELGKR